MSASNKNNPKIILWDIETLPNLQEAMKNFTQLSDYPGKTMRGSINSIICVGYKVLGDKKAKCINAWDFKKRWNKDVNDDLEVVKAAREILKDADAIVTHNGVNFDLKVLNSRLLYHGLPPLPKVAHIDTCAVARSKLSVLNNKLNTVAKFLGCDTKLENGGWELWVEVMRRSNKAQKLMTRYCKQDVEVLEQVYLKMRSLTNRIPNHNVVNTNKKNIVCPSCGSDKIHKNGRRVTQSKIYQRYLCGNCGTTSRSNIKETNLVAF